MRSVMALALAAASVLTPEATVETTEGSAEQAAALKGNPLLIQKIIAERLSDKVQVMMVPTDGKFFFANDVLKGMTASVQ